MPRDPDDIRVCVCSSCGATLLGESEREWANGLSAKHRSKLPPLVGGVRNGRPYCASCMRIHDLGVKRCVSDRPSAG